MNEQNINRINRVLVVGSWAKEEITIANIKQNPDIEVFAYMNTRNPGIVGRVDDYQVGSFKRIDDILDYAGVNNVDLVMVTTASPLVAGLVDLLEKENIKVFGPNREAARLESDKAFTRRLMEKYVPEAIPSFRVFDSVEAAVDFARKLDWQVAVKPVGLTDGLGVKVFGDQLKSESAVVNYITEIHDREISGHSRVIVEYKLTGVEFTVQCFVWGNTLISTPAVQDFKKLLNHEKGPNTASMGSYSDAGYLLPFMNQDDYDRAVQIIQNTIAGFHQETGKNCAGFLYGQFMLCEDGVKLIEYNFRPGDPEWMNTVAVLKGNLADIISALMQGKRPALEFEQEATVCKYVVPPAYPFRKNETLDVTIDPNGIEETGSEIYWSCGVTDQGVLKVGSERGLALLARGDTVFDANRKVEAALPYVRGNYSYRSDIGTRDLVKSKIEIVQDVTGEEINIRSASETDFLDIYDFTSGCPPLENYPEHVYKILLRYFGSTCLVAEIRGRIVGFVLNFFSQTHQEKTCFLWQIGVSPFLQGTGLGKRLLRELDTRARAWGCRRIEATIDPQNTPSRGLFEKMGYQNISAQEGETVEVLGCKTVKDYYKPGRHFMLYEKRLHKEGKNTLRNG